MANSAHRGWTLEVAGFGTKLQAPVITQATSYAFLVFVIWITG